MKLINLKIEGYRKIVAAFFQFSISGNVTQIIGGNEQGKSSVLDTIMILLLGPKYMENNAINKDSEKTVIQGELDNGYVIKRVFTPKSDRIELFRIIEGKMYPESSPQGFLDKLTSIIALRPIAFLNKPAAEKTKIISQCLGINDLLDKNTASIKEYEESRANISRKIKEFGTIPENNPMYEQYKPVDEIAKKIDKAFSDHQVKAQKNFDEQVQRGIRKRDHEEKQEIKTEKLLELQNVALKLETLRKQLPGDMPRLSEFYYESIANINDHIKQSKEFDKVPFSEEPIIPLGPLDITELRAEETEAVEFNKLVDANLANKTKREELETLQKKYVSTDNHVKRLKEERNIIISGAAAKANFPYPITIEDNDILIDGISSNNWSTAQGIMFALEACKMLNPSLRVICIDDAEHLDSKNKLKLHDWAKENDFQTIITIVEGNASNPETYEISEGEIVNIPIIADPMESQIPEKEEKPKKAAKNQILEVPEEKKQDEDEDW